MVDNCRYYQYNEIREHFQFNKSLSIIHLNNRSLSANLKKIIEYLHELSNPFDIVAITVTWISDESNFALEIDNSDMFIMNRKNRIQGGVALDVHQNLNGVKVDKKSLWMI